MSNSKQTLQTPFKNTLKNASKTQDFDANSIENLDSAKNTSTDVQFESIEGIRTRLALSRRQICLLLKVDPSAWSRWSKMESVPRHIFQALSWYLQLVEQNPQMHMPYDLDKKIQSQARESEMRLHHLKKELQALKDQAFSPKNEVVSEIGEKLQESFENILLKFRDQMLPQKAFEMESLKYENRKLADKLQDLQTQMNHLVGQLEKNKAALANTKVSTNSKPKKPKVKAIKNSKKDSKKQSLAKIEARKIKSKIKTGPKRNVKSKKSKAGLKKNLKSSSKKKKAKKSFSIQKSKNRH